MLPPRSMSGLRKYWVGLCPTHLLCKASAAEGVVTTICVQRIAARAYGGQVFAQVCVQGMYRSPKRAVKKAENCQKMLAVGKVSLEGKRLQGRVPKTGF